jgi:SNF2 family DNA or RNA helicase
LWDFVIIDESQVLKARNSGFSRAARRLRHARKRLALSATPLDKTPIDLFGQLRFVDHTILGEDFTSFANEYCYRGGWKGHKWLFRKAKMKQFLDLISPAVYRLTKAFQQLPPLTIVPVPVQLLGDQARIYERMLHHSIIGNTTARLAVTRQVKLEQITGGWVINDFGEAECVGRAKERKLKALVKKLTPPLVVFCKYLHEIPIIYDVLASGRRMASLHGKIKGDARTDVINAFQRGDIDVLVCQVRTGGVSVEFTRSNTMIFYSFGFSMIDFEQIIGRLHRGGQTRPVTVYVMHAVDTVDDEIVSAIEDKYTIFREVTSSVDRNQASDTTQRIVVAAQ